MELDKYEKDGLTLYADLGEFKLVNNIEGLELKTLLAFLVTVIQTCESNVVKLLVNELGMSHEVAEQAVNRFVHGEIDLSTLSPTNEQ